MHEIHRPCPRKRRACPLWPLALLAAPPDFLLPPVAGLALNMPQIGSDPGDGWAKQPQRQRHSSEYGARRDHPTSYDKSPPFKGPLKLGRGRSTSDARQRIRHHYVDGGGGGGADGKAATHLDPFPGPLGESAPTQRMLEAILAHLARRDAPIDAKEVAESVEFFLRTRKRLLGAARRAGGGGAGGGNAPQVTVYDLCSGHGFTGMLFAACYPRAARCVCVDRTEPPSHRTLRSCVEEVCPWTAGAGPGGAIDFVPASLEAFGAGLRSGGGGAVGPSVVISTHACGSLTDQVLEHAVESGAAALAVMPCCYTGTDRGVPYGIRRALGVSWSADIRRSFKLEEAGYHSDFCAIPSEITPMNRVLLGERRGGDQQ